MSESVAVCCCCCCCEGVTNQRRCHRDDISAHHDGYLTNDMKRRCVVCALKERAKSCAAVATSLHSVLRPDEREREKSRTVSPNLNTCHATRHAVESFAEI